MEHGVTAYKRKICRCAQCREANTDYERRQSHRRQAQITRSWMQSDSDTLTLAEYKKFRGIE